MSCNDHNHNNCGCGGYGCSVCAPVNCIDQAVKDALADQKGGLEELTQRAEEAVTHSKEYEELSHQYAEESKGYRDASEVAASTSTQALATITNTAVDLQNTADTLTDIAGELEAAIAGIAVATWFYKTTMPNQQTILVPEDKDAVSVNAIYINGVRQDVNRGFEFDATTRVIKLAEPIEEVDTELVIIIGVYSDNPADFPNTLASNMGASIVGTAEGDTVQVALNKRELAYYYRKGNFSSNVTLTTPTEVIFNNASNLWYRYVGTSALPVTVPAGTNPVGSSEWESVGDSTFKTMLAKATPTQQGAQLVGLYDPVSTTSRTVSDMINNKIAPGIILDHATTSWAKLNADDLVTDHYAAMADLVSSKKYITVDSKVNLSRGLVTSIAGQVIQGTANGRIQPIDPYMAYEVMFRVRSKHVQFLGLTFANPNLYKGHLSFSSAENRPRRQGSIDFGDDFGTVDRCVFRNQLNAVIANISNAAHGTKVLNSSFLDCLGTGAGPDYTNNPYPNSNGGEDRGDAVTLWGSGSVIANNYANCLTGQDARIAFHFESTGSGIVNPREFDRMGNLMTGNIAYGNFRRHFAMENIYHGICSGNTSMGGATWYAEMAIGTNNCIYENTLRYTRTADQLQGGNWGPIRGAIGLANSNKNLKIKSSVFMDTNSAGNGIVINTRTGNHNVEFETNMVNEGDPTNVGVYARATLDKAVFNNIRLKGFGRQISYFTEENASTDLVFNNPDVEGNGTAVAISSTGGRSLDSIKSVGGRWVGNSDSVITATPLRNLTFLGATVGATTYFVNVFSFTAGGSLQVRDCRTVDNARLVQRVASSVSGAFPSNIAWDLDNNLGVIHAFTTSVVNIKSATSPINAAGKYPGKMAVVNNGSGATTDILVAQGSAATAVWKNLTNTASLGDVTPV